MEMNVRDICALLLVFICVSCTQQTSKNNPQKENNPRQQRHWNSRVQIKNGIGRGIFLTDSLGNEYGHGYLENTVITNDSTLTMNLQLAFTKEYHFPAPYNKQQFKVILWPKELMLDKVLSPDSISNELHNYLAYGTNTYNTLNISIKPHEEHVLTFGTLQKYPASCYVSPNMLFVQNDVDLFPVCDNLIKRDLSANPPIVLGLRLDFPDAGCSIIPLAQISYSEH